MSTGSTNRNFAILHDSGECLYLCNVGNGSDIDVSILSGFATSTNRFSTFVQKFHNAKKRKSIVSRENEGAGRLDGFAILNERRTYSRFESDFEQFLFRKVGEFTFIINAPSCDGHDMIARQLFDLESTFILLFGSPGKWTEEAMQIDGLEGTVRNILTVGLASPVHLVGGIPMLLKTNDTKERVDQLLATLESDDSTYSSLLMLDTSVLHSRLIPEETRAIWNFVTVRPLHPSERLRITPVFSEGQWKNLVVFKMKWHTLCVLVTIDSSLTATLPKLETFEHKLESRFEQLQLPIQGNMLSVGDFATIQTIGFVYHDLSTQNTLAPDLREDSFAETHKKILLWFIKRAQDQLQRNQLTTVQLCKTGYRFYATIQPTYELFLLCGSQTGSAEVEAEAEAVLDSIRLTLTL